MARYVGLFLIQLRASVLRALAYRINFFFEGITSLFWSLTAFIPLFVAFHQDKPIAGWSFNESLVVLGLFMLLRSVLDGAVNPSLLTVVEHIRKGTLDFVLLKPADAQFLVSTAKFDPTSAVSALSALGVLVAAFVRLQRLPNPGGIVIALGLLVASISVIYSLWILVVSAAFYVVRVDNLSYLLNSILDAARWPSSVFRGTWHVLFTFVIPLALMTTYPAEALLGHLDVSHALGACVGAAVFALAARAVWQSSLARYTSASS